MKQTSNILLLTLFAALFLLENCAPFTRVYAEEEPGVTLAQYHTFNWLDNTTIKQGNSGPDWLSDGVKSTIRSSVEKQMSRYGFNPCDEKPDLMLHYHVVIKNEVLYVRDWSCGLLVDGPGQYDRCNRIQPVNYREGTLVLDFIETKNGNQVWRGAAVSMLENMKPEGSAARIDAATKAIFKKFPEKPLPTNNL